MINKIKAQILRIKIIRSEITFAFKNRETKKIALQHLQNSTLTNLDAILELLNEELKHAQINNGEQPTPARTAPRERRTNSRS